MFIGREHEMSVLEETYNQPGFQMTVIYGRRRIGKSTLITEFIKDGLDGKLKCMTTNVGKWWGMGHDRVPTDIDVVGIDEIGKKAILGECKFKNEQIDKPVYEDLMNRKGLIDRKYEEVQYMYFSLSGFSKWVVENADAEKVSLLTLDDLYS